MSDGWRRSALRLTSIVAIASVVVAALLGSRFLAPIGAADELTPADNGLSMAIALDRPDVAPGGSVEISVAIRNDRLVPAVLMVNGCGALGTVSALVPVPSDPAGHTWDGIAGAFKAYALSQGNGNAGTPPTLPMPVDGWAPACSVPGDASERTLAPGASATTALLWTADLVHGLPIRPGAIVLRVSVNHDPSGPPPTYPPSHTGAIFSWSTVYKQLTASATIRVTGAAPEVITPGQALDALLADPRFGSWLAEEPVDTWSTANLLLVEADAAGGGVTARPSWEIDLFREIGVPRTWAMGFVDPFTGKVLDLTFCDDPCDR